MSDATPIVFVVDDDVSVRESLEALIRCEGWQPEIFASAQEFLCRPPVAVPSCLVLDVNLPDLNGLDLQKRVGADRTDMPIIFITGYGDVPMTVRAMKAGAVEFLTKPFDDDALLSAIRHAIDRSHTALGQAADIRELRDGYSIAQPPRTGGHGVGGHRSDEQAGRFRARHQRDHGEGTPRPGDAKDEGPLSPRPGEHERETPPRTCAERLTAAAVVARRIESPIQKQNRALASNRRRVVRHELAISSGASTVRSHSVIDRMVRPSDRRQDGRPVSRCRRGSAYRDVRRGLILANWYGDWALPETFDICGA